MEPRHCPLCRSERLEERTDGSPRRYFDCVACGLVHLDPAQRPGSGEERAHYGTHENDPADPRYRAFLARLSAPLVERLAPGASGLDYGSGPGPALSIVLAEQGFRMEIFDPFFAPDPAVLDRTYDFITCTETAEHFFRPREEFLRLDEMLRPRGWLGIMTEVLREGVSLNAWYYARDPTHVCFYRPRTFAWIAGRFGWGLENPQPNVALFRKPDAGGSRG